MKVWLGVLLAIAAVAITAWASEIGAGPGSSKLFVVVAAAVAAAFAPSCVDVLAKRARKRRTARAVAERETPETTAGLLRADRHVVPFGGRERELAELREWCRDDNPPVRLVIGAGGVGKTRLALELGEYLRSCGWRFVVLGAGWEAEALSELREVTRGSIFLVVDYAETRAGLIDLLRSVPGHSWHVRVLLIARDAGDWWRRLGADVPPVRHLVQAYPPMRLGTELGERSGRAELARAIPHFAKALDVAAPRPVDVVVPDEVPLLVLHAAALVAVLRSSGLGYAAPAETLVANLGVLGELLGHEGRYWRHSADRAGLSAVSDAVLRRAVAVSCLFSARDETDGAVLLRRVPDLAQEGDERLRRDVARWLKQLYPSGDGQWGSLQPELVADAHVLRELGECPDLVLAEVSELRPEQAHQMLTVLSLATAHRPADRSLLEQVLRRDVETLLPAALRVTTTSGGALRTVLVRVLANAPLDLASLLRVDQRLPRPTTGLAGAAVVVARRILRMLPPDAAPWDTAHWLEQLAATQAQAGRPVAALRDIRSAVDTYRTLVAEDRPEFRPHLARCLTRLGVRYAELGRHDEAVEHAREAARHYQTLRDGLDRYRADRAACLYDLGVWLVTLGRHEEALPRLEQAVEDYRELVETDLDRYLGDLAEALNSLDGCRETLHRPVEPLPELESAVAHFRGLAATEPDHFRPELARSLANLGRRYLEQAQPGRALVALEEALGLYEALAAANNHYRPDLAACVNNVGFNLFELGRHETAVQYASRAVHLNRALCKVNPRGHRPELALSLDHLVMFLSTLGRYAHSLPYAEEAVGLHRHLATIDPGRFRPELARALTNLGVSLSELGRSTVALQTAREAVSICRELYRADQQRYWRHLLRALENLAVDHAALRQHAAADRCRREADGLRERHGDKRPPPRRWRLR